MSKSLLPLALLAVVACSKTSEKPAVVIEPIPVETAQALIGQFMGGLVGQLTAAIEENGPAGAVGVCSTSAPQLGAELSKGEYTIRRVGTRVRNAKTNTPTEMELQVMQSLSKESPIYQGEIDGHAVYMKGVFIPGPLCLTCHGQAEEIPEDVKQILAERYPQDAAVGYAVGDLRGAVLVERKMK